MSKWKRPTRRIYSHCADSTKRRAQLVGLRPLAQLAVVFGGLLALPADFVRLDGDVEQYLADHGQLWDKAYPERNTPSPR